MRPIIILAALLSCGIAAPAVAGPMATARSIVYFSSAGGSLIFNGTASIQTTVSGDGVTSASPVVTGESLVADVSTSLLTYGVSTISERIELSNLTITNTSNATFSGPIYVNFSSSREDLIAIDNASGESASFSASLGGPYAEDSHGCSLSPSGSSTDYATISIGSNETRCLVSGADESEELLLLPPLASGASVVVAGAYTLDVTASVSWVPEPASISLLVMGVGMLGMIRRRNG